MLKKRFLISYCRKLYVKVKYGARYCQKLNEQQVSVTLITVICLLLTDYFARESSCELL